MSAAVVRLPTAASHKVNNSRWMEQRRAGARLRNEQGAFHHLLSSDRAAVIKAERLATFMEQNSPLTPFTAVAIGLIKLLDQAQLEKLCLSVMPSAEAMTLVELARADSGMVHMVHCVLTRRGFLS